MLKIHETSRPGGVLSPVFLRWEGGVLTILGDEGTFVLPEGALGSVMKRFGRPFDPAAPVAPIAALDLEDGRSLRHVRHLARYDVIALDYLVLCSPDHEPLCALATAVTAALYHLGRARARARTAETERNE